MNEVPKTPHNREPGTGASAAERLSQAQAMTEETALRLLRLVEGAEPVKRIRGSQLASGVLGGIGLALFIVGVERAAEDLPIVSNAYGSIFVGLVLLAVTGLLLAKLSGGGEG